MNYMYHYTVTMMGSPEPMPSGKDMYKEGGLKCKSISSMECMLDYEAKTNFKQKENVKNEDD